MSKVYLGLGTNMGERLVNLAAMLSALRDKADVREVSSVYETEPVGFLEQPSFLNAVCLVETRLSPMALLKLVKEIETSVGPRSSFRNGPRHADIDILFYDDLVLETTKLIIPHPRVAGRAFVLAPLAEIAPELVHPILGRNVKELLASVKKPWGVKRLPTSALPPDLASLFAKIRRQQVRD